MLAKKFELHVTCLDLYALPAVCVECRSAFISSEGFHHSSWSVQTLEPLLYKGVALQVAEDSQGREGGWGVYWGQ